MNLTGKKIFITGGSRGIGASIVKVCAENSATVAFTYSQNEESAKNILNSLSGSDHMMLKMDINSEESIDSCLKTLLDQWGTLDGLVNNAGITKDQLLLRMKVEDFDKVIHTNLRGTFLVTQKLLKPFLKNKGGSIVNITSIVGQTGNPGQANYSASKAGVEAFSRSTALEIASRGIRVNCIAPGFIATDMTAALTEDQMAKMISEIPMGRVGTAEEVAQSTLFLLSDFAKYITGHTLSVNGGMFMN